MMRRGKVNEAAAKEAPTTRHGDTKSMQKRSRLRQKLGKSGREDERKTARIKMSMKKARKTAGMKIAKAPEVAAAVDSEAMMQGECPTGALLGCSLMHLAGWDPTPRGRPPSAGFAGNQVPAGGPPLLHIETRP